MNVRFNKLNKEIKKFQEGGQMEAAEELAPVELAPVEQQQSADPMQMLMQLGQGAALALQTKDCNTAFQVCDGLILFLQMAQGGLELAPAEGEPVYRKGGVLSRRIK